MFLERTIKLEKLKNVNKSKVLTFMSQENYACEVTIDVRKQYLDVMSEFLSILKTLIYIKRKKLIHRKS